MNPAAPNLVASPLTSKNSDYDFINDLNSKKLLIIVANKKLKLVPEKQDNDAVYTYPSFANAILVNKSPIELPILNNKAVMMISSHYKIKAKKLAPSTKTLHTNPKKPILIMAAIN